MFYDIQCDYSNYPEVLELFSLGVKPFYTCMAVKLAGDKAGTALARRNAALWNAPFCFQKA